jgi:tRNA G10  N-methylase Trm11
MKYAFILGNHPELSSLEIMRVLEKQQVAFEVLAKGADVLLIETKSAMQAQLIQDTLGGTIKIVEIIDEFNGFSNKKIQIKAQHVLDDIRTAQQLERVHVGFSAYLLSTGGSFKNEPLVRDAQKRIFRIGMTLKKQLQAKNISVKLVQSKEAALSSFLVEKYKLLYKGTEFCVFIAPDKSVYLGQTLAIQNYKRYSKIDYGRPGRDDFSGMLPPKLAQMMINLAQINADQRLYDAFCGSGTVLTQALLLGYKKILGSDISEKAVVDTQKNIQWLYDRRIRDIAGAELNPDQLAVAEVDVQRCSQWPKARKVAAIVNEPYMGPPQKGQAQLAERQQVMQELSSLFIAAFKEFHEILDENGVVVMIFPAFVVNKKTTIYAPVLDQIRRIGFEVQQPFADTINYSQRGSLVYARSGQHVAREIFILKKS